MLPKLPNVTLPQALTVLACLAALIAAPLLLKDNPIAATVTTAASGVILAFTRALTAPPPGAPAEPKDGAS